MERKVKDKIIKDFDSIIKLALSNINNEYLFICNEINLLNPSESVTLNYFMSQEPTSELHPEFYDHEWFKGDYVWFWNNDLAGTTVTYAEACVICNNLRVDFLKKLIGQLIK